MKHKIIPILPSIIAHVNFPVRVPIPFLISAIKRLRLILSNSLYKRSIIKTPVPPAFSVSLFCSSSF